MIGRRRLVPAWSRLALLTLHGSVLVAPESAAGGLIRLSFVVASTAYVLLWPRRDRIRARRRRSHAVTRVT
ncbi:hypothetical protein ACFPK5_24285 [Streptomyces beijiangensis]|uniref:hypothetical protein n=1 Tax=Streptomyces beijiangensis TaxID=163361 RepID=UPI00361B9D6B